MNKAVHRNDPCWCGSGKKFKKCHLSEGDDAPVRAASEPKAPTAGAGGLLSGLFSKKRNPLLLTPGERDAMRQACRFNAQLMDFIRPEVKAGVTTEALDRMVHDYTRDHGHVPACLGYHGFPKSSCTSINEVVCHGIPDKTVLRDGDIVNIDLTTIVDGWHGDQSETILIGEVTHEARRVTQCSFDSLNLAIKALKPGVKIIEIGKAIAHHAEPLGFSVVREYQGHGIGRQFHQEPGIPHYPEMRVGARQLEPGLCFTIEPMINCGTWRTVLDKKDGWTVRTADGKLSAQFEHTILMTEDGPEVLTETQSGPKPGHRF